MIYKKFCIFIKSTRGKKMNTEIKNTIHASDIEAQYDEKAKRLLSNKIILAYILVNTIKEFQGMSPKDVVSYIEGEPFVGVVPIESGLTNVEKENDGQRIVGMNTEAAEINEGLIRFDIIFYVRLPLANSKKSDISQVIVNVEAQKDEPTKYPILDRAVFYVSRLISSQKERDFVKTNYNDIKRVFSIWICMNMKENSMSYVHLTKDDIVGGYQWKGRLDLLNIVLIGIADEVSQQDDKYELHRLLNTLFSMDLSAARKLEIMETEYHILTDDGIREDVTTMCNLSQGILEKGEARGEARGEVRGEEKKEAKIILNMYKKGYTLEQIADVTDKSAEEIKAIIEKGC